MKTLTLKRLEKKLNDVNSFSNLINNVEKMITYSKNKINELKKKYKKDKTINTILKSIDTFNIVATTSSSITLSLTGIGLIVIPKLTASACIISKGNKVRYGIIINKYNKYEKQNEKDQLTNKSFDNLYRGSLQDNLLKKREYESICNVYTKDVDENKNQSFLIKYEYKKNKNYSNNKLNFQPRT